MISAACGAVLGDLEAYFSDMDFLQAYLANDTGQTMIEQFIALMVVIMSMVSAVPAVVTMLKLKGEEDKTAQNTFMDEPYPVQR